MKNPAAKHASFLRTLALVLMLGALEFAGVLAVSGVFSTPADAQFFRERRVRQGGFFDQLFGGGRNVPYYETNRPPPSPEAAPSSVRPPAPKKTDTTPTLTVTVFGDSMADWLAYGLEEAFEDAPEIGVVRKGKIGSGLLRYDARSDLDWWNVVRDTLAQEKTDFVVMMLGINDRQNIRESQIQKAAEKAAKEKEDKKDEKEQAASDPNDENAPAASNDDDDEIMTPERRPKPVPRGVVEFRSERWEQVYGKRIDDTIAALKSKGVPVLWVGLPPIRGTKSTANVQYLNDLFRARAEKAGITFVDVWDGFVDEGGKFTTFGPDFEGQTRRLRSGDGVHFTKSGARKLAHFVERDLRRFMSNRALPVALPSGGGVVPDANLGPAERPLAGPVVPLTAQRGGTEELAGGGATRPVHSDPTATRVLVKGETIRPPRGRADDFTWPRQSAGTEQLSPTAAAARAATPQTATPTAPAAAKPMPAAPPVAATPAKPESKPDRSASRTPAAAPPPHQPAPHQQAPKPAQPAHATPRPPAQVQAQQQRRPPPQPRRDDGGLFGLGIFR